MPGITRIARWLGIAVLFPAYLILVHYAITSAQAGMLKAILVAAPLLIIGLALAWRAERRPVGLALLGLACGAVWAGWPAIEHHAGLIFWIQDVSLQLTLFITFGRTLLAGRKPLCVYFAEMTHGSLMPQQEQYARQVTVAWVVFFGMMAVTSTLLFFLAPLATWSIFANFLFLPLTALMFIVEYQVRRYVLPDIPSGHILDAVRAYRNSSAHAD